MPGLNRSVYTLELKYTSVYNIKKKFCSILMHFILLIKILYSVKYSSVPEFGYVKKCTFSKSIIPYNWKYSFSVALILG